MTRKILSLLLCLCLMLSLASFSFAEGAFTPGEYEATSQGFGGAVAVKLTVDGEKVTAAEVSGPNETPAIGGQALEQFKTRLIGITSADEVDAVSGATFTSTGIKMAVADCLAQAQGSAAAEAAPLTDGTYSAEGFGFNLTVRVPVTVEVQDGKLAAVTVGENGETNGPARLRLRTASARGSSMP